MISGFNHYNEPNSLPINMDGGDMITTSISPQLFKDFIANGKPLLYTVNFRGLGVSISSMFFPYKITDKDHMFGVFFNVTEVGFAVHGLSMTVKGDAVVLTLID